MRKISVKKIYDAIYEMVQSSNYQLPSNVKKKITQSANLEKNEMAKLAFQYIIKNYKLAEKNKTPICQDTGLIVVMLEIGQEILFTNGDINETIQKAVADGSRDGYLRKSVVSDPFKRKNTNTNTPAIVHYNIVPGDKVKITIMPKGGGAENMSFVKMLPPSVSKVQIEDIVVDWVKQSGTNPCPPIIVGIGIGGNFEHVAYLAKKALLRRKANTKKEYKNMERKIFDKINQLGIGPQVPTGGNVTSLAVYIETAPCHIASLPLAVNINCHASRYKEVIL